MKMIIKVCEKPCDQCLFSDKKIVSDERKEEIITELEANEGWFECHKGTINEDRHMCYGWYIRYKDIIGILKIANRMGMLKLSPVPKVEV